MLSLLRLALTAAVMVAIALRLRRPPTPNLEVPPPTPGRPTVAPTRPASGVAGVLPRRRGMRAGVLVGAIVVALLAGVYVVAQAGTAVAPTARAVATAEAMATEAAMATVMPSPGPSAADACAQPRRPVVIRPIDPRVRRAVNRQWRAIERWMKANAPESHAALTRPARARTIAIAEAQMGVEFPDDLRASLLRHNGGFTFAGDEAMSVREIRDEWRTTCAHGGDLIPFTRHHAVDSATGRIVIMPDRQPSWPSYLALLQGTAEVKQIR